MLRERVAGESHGTSVWAAVWYARDPGLIPCWEQSRLGSTKLSSNFYLVLAPPFILLKKS